MIEFVLCLPLVMFALAMFFTLGTGLLRKQRTIEAARYAVHATIRGIGDPDEFHWQDSGPDDAQYPDPPEEYPMFSWRGQVHPLKVWEEYFHYLPTGWVDVRSAHGGDTLDDLRAEIDRLDTDDDVYVTEVVPSFWENDAEDDPEERADWTGRMWTIEAYEFNGHWWPRGARVFAQYKPSLLKHLGGPFASRYVQDHETHDTWLWARPDMWAQLFWSEPLRLSELHDNLEQLDEIVHRFSNSTDRTAFERWVHRPFGHIQTAQ